MLTIIDYRAGNLTSVQLAFASLDIPARITRDSRDILEADRIVFPGVGTAGAAMRNIQEQGIAAAVREAVNRGTPFLGICLGAQIVFELLEEDGGVQGLGLLPGTVRKFQPLDRRDKVPQIGWNAVHWSRPHPLCRNIEQDSEFYFVHSYYMQPGRPEILLGQTDYAGITFAAAAGQANLAALQFHPEKSGRIGLQLLRNFADWDGQTGSA
ncbi:MAG: imidazole glycerol phosphate synthase subunit HisH [Kiritimatiellia bacterium]|nr:imidazole glycerol phosphate synthase subunit HisH [Lentisphaerota bacterium]